MVNFWATREFDKLTPVDAESWEEFSKVPFGKPVHVEVKQPRNPAHHRLFFTLVHRMANALGVHPEALRDHLTVKAGHVYVVKTRDGVFHYPKSISFASMDQTDFTNFFNRCIVVICDDWGLSRPDLLDACRDLIDGNVEQR